jgi:hypothetical protein
MKSLRGLFALVVLARFVVACGQPAGGGPDGAVTGDGRGLDGSVASDGGPDASTAGDGAPQRKPCTKSLGTKLTTSFGRLDGYLRAIVPPGGGCTADADHVHLQIEANGATYDIAVNVYSSTSSSNVHTLTRDLPLPGGTPWTEGWHPSLTNDYPTLGIHSVDLTSTPKSQLTTDLMNDLATVNHISVFGTGYGPDGAHLIHRNGSGHDGLVIAQPLSSPAHLRAFAFDTQAF